MRHAPSGQHRLRDVEEPDCLRDAGAAGERSRVTGMAASEKDAATVLVFWIVVPRKRQLRQKRHCRYRRY